MKKTLFFGFIVLLFISFYGIASATSTSFYANTNEIGYQGTVWNITDQTAPWETSTPRNANLYSVFNAPEYDDNYNVILSSWFEHQASNQNDSFLQLAEGIGYGNNLTVTNAIGGWDSTMKIFTVDVSGENSVYPYSRFWQPDNGVAWGVTFTDYSYSLMATFSDKAIVDNGYYVNSVDPDSITGSFSGEFVVTYDVDKNPTDSGDTYGFDIALNKDLFDSNISNLYGYEGTGIVYNEFGEPVPEPTTMLLLGAGLLGLAGLGRKKFFKKD